LGQFDGFGDGFEMTKETFLCWLVVIGGNKKGSICSYGLGMFGKKNGLVSGVGASSGNDGNAFIHDIHGDSHDSFMFLWRKSGRLPGRSTRYNSLCSISNMEFDEVSHGPFIEFPLGEWRNNGD
jgi:hypothetical protein